MNEKEWLIWSGEHGAWWRPDGCGYTTELLAAGLYTKDRAESFVKGCGPEKRVSIVHWAEAWRKWVGTGPGPGTVGAALDFTRDPPLIRAKSVATTIDTEHGLRCARCSHDLLNASSDIDGGGDPVCMDVDDCIERKIARVRKELVDKHVRMLWRLTGEVEFRLEAKSEGHLRSLVVLRLDNLVQSIQKDD